MGREETYAATLAAKVFRALCAIIAAFDLETFAIDAVNAFVNSNVEGVIYCEPPDGFKQHA